MLGLLPGIVFLKSYRSGRFPRALARPSPLAELSLYVVFALPIDSLFVMASENRTQPYRLEVAVKLLTNTLTEAELPELINRLNDSWQWLIVQYLALLASSFIAGLIVRRVVWACRLDLKVPILRMRHEWYYVLQGRLPGHPRQVLPYADILVELPGEGCRLYRGIVTALEPTDDGQVNALYLEDVSRGKGRGAKFRWVEVPSNQFLVLGSTIHSINMRYFGVESERDAGKWGRLKAVWRSLVFEDP
jgi:hypothetical protein